MTISFRCAALCAPLMFALSVTASLPAQDLRAYDMVGERRTAGRLFHAGGSEFPAHFSVTWGAPSWKAEYEQMVTSGGATGPARLGKNLWTTFENSVAMQFGQVLVPAGQYYVAIERLEDGTLQLLLYDAGYARHAQMMPFAAVAGEQEFALPLTLTKTDEVVDELSFRTAMAKDDPVAGTLSLHWGPFVASTEWRAFVRGTMSKKEVLDYTLIRMIVLLRDGHARELTRTFMPGKSVMQDGIARVLSQPQINGSLIGALAKLRSEGYQPEESTTEIPLVTPENIVSGFRLLWEDGIWALRGGAPRMPSGLLDGLRKKSSEPMTPERRAALERARAAREEKVRAQKERDKLEEQKKLEEKKAGGGEPR